MKYTLSLLFSLACIHSCISIPETKSELTKRIGKGIGTALLAAAAAKWSYDFAKDARTSLQQESELPDNLGLNQENKSSWLSEVSSFPVVKNGVASLALGYTAFKAAQASVIYLFKESKGKELLEKAKHCAKGSFATALIIGNCEALRWFGTNALKTIQEKEQEGRFLKLLIIISMSSALAYTTCEAGKWGYESFKKAFTKDQESPMR